MINTVDAGAGGWACGHNGSVFGRRKKDNAVLVGGPLGGQTAYVDPDAGQVRLPTAKGHSRYRRTALTRSFDGRTLVEFEWFTDET